MLFSFKMEVWSDEISDWDTTPADKCVSQPPLFCARFSKLGHSSRFTIEYVRTLEKLDRHISKRGNAALRKYCFEVMQALKLTRPQDDPVYLFLLKKEQEGKPYNVAKMAGVNKFLRIYYARAMETLKQQ